MIAAISSHGSTYFSINQGKTTSLTFCLFISSLCNVLDKKDYDWRKKSTLLIDNASIHRSRETKAYFAAIGLPIMYLAPYSFKMAAVEKLFAIVKNRDLNPLVSKTYSR
jgi:transposase